MSTNLKPIKGKVFNELKLTRFYGGEVAGICLQITQKDAQGNYSYVALSKKDMTKLAKRFKTFTKEKEDRNA